VAGSLRTTLVLVEMDVDLRTDGAGKYGKALLFVGAAMSLSSCGAVGYFVTDMCFKVSWISNGCIAETEESDCGVMDFVLS
jgi:hypothetical protein